MSERYKTKAFVSGFVQRDGKILCIREHSSIPTEPTIVMSQPGGHMEEGEFTTNAIIREVLEETGYHVEPTEIVEIGQVLKPDHPSFYVTFVCELTSDVQEPIAEDGIVETLWLTEEEIMNRTEEHRDSHCTHRFRAYFQGKRLPLSTITTFDYR